MSSIKNAEIKKIFSSYKSKAKSRGLSFKLDLQYFSIRCIQLCYICGEKGKPYNGVDRINNKNGYTIGNTAACCWSCNRAKNDMSLSEFENWMSKLKAEPSEEYQMRKGKMELCEEMDTDSPVEAIFKKHQNNMIKLEKTRQELLTRYDEVTTGIVIRRLMSGQTATRKDVEEIYKFRNINKRE